MKAFVVLENGKVFEGKSFGAQKEAVAELVFSTDMVGYQEVLTDSVYQNKAVIMTYPMIGNSGISKDCAENKRACASALIVKEACKYPSNHTSFTTLGDYLVKCETLGVEGIDTRELTRLVRDSKEPLKAVIIACDETPDFEKLALKARETVV